MKTKEKALAEWVSDEILFDDTHLTGFKVFTRAEFTGACKLMRGQKSGASVPLLQEPIIQLWNAMTKCAFWTEERAHAWLDRFFAPENLVRFTDPYTIKSALVRKTKSLQANASGTLYNVLK